MEATDIYGHGARILERFSPLQSTTVAGLCSSVSLQIFFEVAKEERLPDKDDIVVAHAWWYSIFGPTSRGLCLNGLTRLSWSSKQSPCFGRVSRLFRDYRRAQSVSDLAVPMLQSDNRICR